MEIPNYKKFNSEQLTELYFKVESEMNEFNDAHNYEDYVKLKEQLLKIEAFHFEKFYTAL